MTPKRLVAMAHVKNVGISIAFYERLGFAAANTFTPPGATEPAWACLESNSAQLMVTLADEPVNPSQQAVLFYVYYDDIQAVHAKLKADGLPVGPLAYPFYRPDGECRLTDPDGYCLMLTHN